MPDPNNPGLGGLGDMQHKSGDPLETYFDINRQGIRLPVRRDIVHMPVSPEREKDPLWRNLTDFKKLLECGTYFVKGPNWLEPPVTARPLDIRTETCVAVSGGISGTDATVLTFTIPDRHVGTLLGFGHELDIAAQWGNVRWTIRVNRAPLPFYHNFRQQIGMFVDPTRFPAPFRVKSFDVIEVIANNSGSGVNVCAFARLIGFYFPVRNVTQDGSYGEYHTI